MTNTISRLRLDLKYGPRFLPSARNKREGRENRPRSRHCERRALLVYRGSELPAKPLPRYNRWGGKVKQGRVRAASQETCLGVQGHIVLSR